MIHLKCKKCGFSAMYCWEHFIRQLARGNANAYYCCMGEMETIV